jgi:hypothetical protein
MASYPLYPFTTMCPVPFRGFSYPVSALVNFFEAFPAPYGNTKEILVYNTSSTDPLYVGIIEVFPTAPIGIPALGIGTRTAGDITQFLSLSTLVPAGAGITLAIGPEGYRVPMATSLEWFTTTQSYGAYFTGSQANANLFNPPPYTTPVRVGSGYNLVFYAPTVTIDFDVNVTYVQSQGGAGGITP